MTEARLVFKTPPPLRGFARRRAAPAGARPACHPASIPATAIRLRLEARRADSPSPEPITLDMEFADEGGEGPSPYEVLLDGRHGRRGAALHPPGGASSEQWRIMQPLLDAPPPVLPYAPGIGRARRRRRPGRARTADGAGPGRRRDRPRRIPHRATIGDAVKATQQLHEAGQSIWLDNITRDLLTSGTLARYIADLSVTGLTSNPTIFDLAIRNAAPTTPRSARSRGGAAARSCSSTWRSRT